MTDAEIIQGIRSPGRYNAMVAMSYMIEVYYRAPQDSARECLVAEKASEFGGSLTFREGPSDEAESVCLTYEFATLRCADDAARALRERGIHVEGPCDYGDG